jgi:two-component system response regulator AtoC
MVIGDWEEIIHDLYLKNQSATAPRTEELALKGASIVDVLLDFKGEYSSDQAAFSLKKITKKATDRIEKEVISFVLDKTGWNRTNASKILKISYKTLLYKISGLDIKQQR